MGKFSWFGNLALTLDQKLGEDDKRTHISNKRDFQTVHSFRNEIAAIGIGSSTVLIDNPSLRTKQEYLFTPVTSHIVPIIFDRRGRMPPSARVVTTFPDRPVLWVTNSKNKELPANIRKIPYVDIQVVKNTIEDVLDSLHRQGPIMIEGGMRLMKSLIDTGILRRLRIFISSELLPDASNHLDLPNGFKYQLLGSSQLASGLERVFAIHPCE